MGQVGGSPQQVRMPSSFLMAHAKPAETATALKAPAGAVFTPKLARPQHNSVLLSSRAHVFCQAPPTTDFQVPPGAVACPWTFQPQHDIDRFACRPHACDMPVVMD